MTPSLAKPLQALSLGRRDREAIIFMGRGSSIGGQMCCRLATRSLSSHPTLSPAVSFQELCTISSAVRWAVPSSKINSFSLLTTRAFASELARRLLRLYPPLWRRAAALPVGPATSATISCLLRREPVRRARFSTLPLTKLRPPAVPPSPETLFPRIAFRRQL